MSNTSLLENCVSVQEGASCEKRLECVVLPRYFRSRTVLIIMCTIELKAYKVFGSSAAFPQEIIINLKILGMYVLQMTDHLAHFSAHHAFPLQDKVLRDPSLKCFHFTGTLRRLWHADRFG